MSFKGTLNNLSLFYMLGKAAWNVYNLANAPSPNVEGSAYPYRPAEWVSRQGGLDVSDQAELVSIIPNNISRKELKNNEETGDKEQTTVGYFFDAFIREGHSGTVKVTEHPVQTGANISDHAYNLPDRLNVEIFVSDSMDEVLTGQFSDYETKSVSAYMVLRKLKEERQLVNINTRLFYYENMIIETLDSDDDYKMANGLKCLVSFRQVMIASVAKQSVNSVSSQTINQNKKGPQNTETPKSGSLLYEGLENKKQERSAYLDNTTR